MDSSYCLKCKQVLELKSSFSRPAVVKVVDQLE